MTANVDRCPSWLREKSVVQLSTPRIQQLLFVHRCFLPADLCTCVWESAPDSGQVQQTSPAGAPWLEARPKNIIEACGANSCPSFATLHVELLYDKLWWGHWQKKVPQMQAKRQGHPRKICCWFSTWPCIRCTPSALACRQVRPFELHTHVHHLTPKKLPLQGDKNKSRLLHQARQCATTGLQM